MASPPATPSSQMKGGARNAPTIINIPPPDPNIETPEPGTPTSTTTSLSALSTVAIKDGHRGHGLQAHRGHAHQNSTNSLDAERADRISRLAGLERVSTLRAPAHQQYPHPTNPSAAAPTSAQPLQQSPTSDTAGPGFYPLHSAGQPTSSFPPGTANGTYPPANPPNAFFDANGQPTVHNKISTIGTASATSGGTPTASLSGNTRTFTTTSSDPGDPAPSSSSPRSDDDEGTLPDRDDEEEEEDMRSMDTNIRSLSSSKPAHLPRTGSAGTGGGGGMMMMLDTDTDRISDDGTASLVGFGEGANSTVSGPIYQRRPVPGGTTANMFGGLERSSSGLSEGAVMARRDLAPGMVSTPGSAGGGGGGGGGGGPRAGFGPIPPGGGGGGGADTPMSMTTRDGRAGMFADVVVGIPSPPLPPGESQAGEEEEMGGGAAAGGDGYYETAAPSADAAAGVGYGVGVGVGGVMGPGAPVTQQNLASRPPYSLNPTTRETAERIIRERLDHGESRAGGPAMTSPGTAQRLGQFYFEDGKHA